MASAGVVDLSEVAGVGVGEQEAVWGRSTARRLLAVVPETAAVV
jgi:hypothetical protein